MSNSPIIEICGLYKIFGSKPEAVLPQVIEGASKESILSETGHTVGLRNINLKIQRGETFVVMGLSGSGKSTLIRHFNRLIDPTKGQIMVDGVDIMQLERKHLEVFRRQKMSMVFQRFGLLPHRNVLDNIAFGLEIQGISKKARLEKARKWLDIVGLNGYENHFPSGLSGGQQQRVGLARALAIDADILLMDEAFSALDPLIRSEMQDQLIALQKQLNKTIIFITHDLDEALRLGDKIAILKDGELVQVGAPKAILLSPADDYVEAFVKDVNRARALTVETLMQPSPFILNTPNPSEALFLMQQANKLHAYHNTASGYQGFVTQQGLKEALQQSQSIAWDKLYEPLPPVSPESTIESVLAHSMSFPYALPVVDNLGHLVGELVNTDVASLLNDNNSISTQAL